MENVEQPSRQVRSSAKWARIQLAILFIVAAFGYLVFPLVAQEVAEMFPQVEHLVVPYSVAAIIMTVCIQVLLVCIWLVVGRVGSGTFYRGSTARIIQVAGAAALVGCLMPAGVCLHMGLVEMIGGPLMLPGMIAALVVGVALALLSALLVQIFRDAKANSDELAEVI